MFCATLKSNPEPGRLKETFYSFSFKCLHNIYIALLRDNCEHKNEMLYFCFTVDMMSQRKEVFTLSALVK